MVTNDMKIWFHTIKPDGKRGMFGLLPEEVLHVENLWYSGPIRTGITYFDFFTAMYKDELNGSRLTDIADLFRYPRAWNRLNRLRKQQEYR